MMHTDAGVSADAGAGDAGADTDARVRRTRLTPEREGELYEAVIDLLCEVGYESLTMDAVASRTRSSKATLYRQWKGKPELVATALRHARPVSVGDVDTGSLRGDLHGLIECSSGDEERDDAIMRAMSHAAHRNPDLNKALREMLIEPELAAFEAMLQRAVDRGEVAADLPALEFVPHMLVGVAMARPLIDNRIPDPEFFARYIDAVVLPALRLS